MGPEAESIDEALRPNVEQVADDTGEINPSAPKRQKTLHAGGFVASATTKDKESLVYKPYEASKSTEQSYKGDTQIEGVHQNNEVEKDKEEDGRSITVKASKRSIGEEVGREEDHERSLYKGKLPIGHLWIETRWKQKHQENNRHTWSTSRAHICAYYVSIRLST